jgi:hypothetical protein
MGWPDFGGELLPFGVEEKHLNAMLFLSEPYVDGL